MVTPMPGEMPSAAGLDLARVRLGVIPRAPLLARGAGPSDPSQAGGKGLIVADLSLLCLLVVAYTCLSVSFLGGSADTLSWWAEHLHDLYTEIGG